ncbi:MAG: T9SS type A sorting domain-containing protein [FCB group bacterium]|nr:T9SS type A sorting domain-containing protein [FCB group bacterium]
MKRASIAVIVVLAFMVSGAFASGDGVYPLAPKGKDRLALPQESTDPMYPVSHVDANAEYYLGSGAADDTFFITFEPPAACSVKYVEIQWFDGGNVNAFAAWYSDDAHISYPGGTAPNRGESPVSPIGDWFAGPVPNTAGGSQAWELLDLGGTEWVVGDPITLESDIFGIGFIKGAAEPHPLADNMSGKGIRMTYTWFGGPWMATYPYPWGAYSGDIEFGTVVDVMMQVWVTYPWGMPILVSDLIQVPNTFDTAGPYTITCGLVDDDPGITAADVVELYYVVDAGTPTAVPLVETSPGSGVFAADIPGQAIGCAIDYWVECIDDVGLQTTTFSKSFSILEPVRPEADVLLVNNGIDDRASAYYWALDNLDVYYEEWDVGANMGIDESVTNYGWGTIIASGWGISSLPCLDEENPYTAFLDGGGNLAVMDQDWFYAQGLPAEGSFAAGDFAYDYMGISDYWNDFGTPDVNYFGQDNPISGDWENAPYETYWDTLGVHMPLTSLWADWFTEGAADNIFWGENDGFSYGCSYDNTYKTVFLSFMPEANCGYDESGYWATTPDFQLLLGNVFDWFVIVEVEPQNELSPFNYSLNQNYPNPFNPTTSINFSLANAGDVSLKVFNIMGQEVATVLNGNLNSGPHSITFDASSLSSGLYYYQIEAGDFQAAKQMVLVK